MYGLMIGLDFWTFMKNTVTKHNIWNDNLLILDFKKVVHLLIMYGTFGSSLTNTWPASLIFSNDYIAAAGTWREDIHR